VGATRKVTDVLGGSPLETLRKMDPEQRRSVLWQWCGRVLFAAGLVAIGGTAALAIRAPIVPSSLIEQIASSDRAIDRLAKALLEKENNIDLVCSVREKDPPPDGPQKRIMILFCQPQSAFAP
jgi:hypothetical protein